MRNYICIIFLSLIFYSCSQRNHIPSDIMKPSEMQNILWDMLRADILAQETVKKDSGKTIKLESNFLNEKIFLIHKTSRSEFEKSLVFYQEHPGLMKTIFDSMNAQQTRKNYMHIEPKKHRAKVTKAI